MLQPYQSGEQSMLHVRQDTGGLVSGRGAGGVGSCKYLTTVSKPIDDIISPEGASGISSQFVCVRRGSGVCEMISKESSMCAAGIHKRTSGDCLGRVGVSFGFWGGVDVLVARDDGVESTAEGCAVLCGVVDTVE